MHPYKLLAHQVGTQEALELADRLAAWHDAMVAHERQLRASGFGPDACAESECPHVEVPDLWSEALRTFGDRALELTFLRSRTRVGAVTDQG